MSRDPWEAMQQDKVVAVVRAEHVPDPAGLADALAEGGIGCVEFTFTIPDVERVIEAAASGAQAGIVGAGTVLDTAQVASSLRAGARFVVAPALRPTLVAPCRAAGAPVFLGAATPTEVVEAYEAGATAVKLFPASLGGVDFVQALRGPLPHVPLIPSGGVDERTAPAYLAAGAVAVYAGSGVAPPELIEANDLAEVSRRARRFTAALA